MKIRVVGFFKKNPFYEEGKETVIGFTKTELLHYALF